MRLTITRAVSGLSGSAIQSASFGARLRRVERRLRSAVRAAGRPAAACRPVALASDSRPRNRMWIASRLRRIVLDAVDATAAAPASCPRSSSICASSLAFSSSGARRNCICSLLHLLPESESAFSFHAACSSGVACTMSLRLSLREVAPAGGSSRSAGTGRTCGRGSARTRGSRRGTPRRRCWSSR